MFVISAAVAESVFVISLTAVTDTRPELWSDCTPHVIRDDVNDNNININIKQLVDR